MIGGRAGQDIPGRGRGLRAARDRHEHWVFGRAGVVPLPNVREGRGRSETEFQIMATPVPQTLCPRDFHSRVMRPDVSEPLCVASDPEPLVELPEMSLFTLSPRSWVWPSPDPALPCLSPACLLQVSETLVQRNGDFLIRDSLTSLGDYVLTCRWHNQALHFKINKVVVKAGESYTHIQYLFEQESFDHVPALVRYHVGSRKAVSEQSGAIIYCPVNRTFPLRYLEACYGLGQGGGKAASPASPSGPKGSHMKRRSVTMTDGLTADKVTRSDGCPTR